VFLLKKVDVAIYKSYFNSKFNAINIVRNSVVTVVISIIINYIKLFSFIIKNIAWYKVKIFKSGSLIFSAF